MFILQKAKSQASTTTYVWFTWSTINSVWPTIYPHRSWLFWPNYHQKGKTDQSKQGTYKRYGVVFTCLMYRVVHLELAGDLSTNCLVMALQRFTSRRGNPRSMWSNNGQNSVWANRELRFLLKGLDKTAITNNLPIRNIQWHFIPPSSPWMDGAWESLVKVTKKALKSEQIIK